MDHTYGISRCKYPLFAGFIFLLAALALSWVEGVVLPMLGIDELPTELVIIRFLLGAGFIFSIWLAFAFWMVKDWASPTASETDSIPNTPASQVALPNEPGNAPTESGTVYVVVRTAAQGPLKVETDEAAFQSRMDAQRYMEERQRGDVEDDLDSPFVNTWSIRELSLR